MQYLNLANKATNLVKGSAGFLQGFTVANAGTTWTLQIFDSANTGTPANPIYGATAITVPSAGTQVVLNVHFSNGLIFLTAGTTAGELVVEYY